MSLECVVLVLEMLNCGIAEKHPQLLSEELFVRSYKEEGRTKGRKARKK